MALPASRNTTYAAGSQIKSTDLNDLQDCVINGKHGLATRLIAALGGQSSTTAGTVPGSTSVRTGASGGTYYRQFDIDVGKRIVNVRVRLKDNAGTTCTVALMRDVDGTQTSISAVGTSAGTNVYQTLTASAINHTVTTGGQYAFAFTFGGAAANCDLNRIEIDYDRP